MGLSGFQFASAGPLVYQLLKFGLLALLVFSSSIWSKSWWLLVVLLVMGAVLTAVGLLFKVEHWASGTELMLAGAALLAGSYAWWYRLKPKRFLLDHLKMAWVLAACAAVVAAAIHVLVKTAAGISEALFWGVALLFVYQKWIRRAPRNAPDS